MGVWCPPSVGGLALCPPVPSPRRVGGGVLVVAAGTERTPILRIIRIETHRHEGLAVEGVVVSDGGLTASAQDA